MRVPHHHVHYKKEGIVSIIRKVLTCNMYHDTTFSNTNSVKGISTNSITAGTNNFGRYRRQESNDAAATLNTPGHQQIFGALPNGLQIGERRPLNSRMWPTVLLCPTYLCVSMQVHGAGRAKSEGGYWGEPPVSLIENCWSATISHR